MTVISSFRPLGEHPEYDHNQMVAKASWEGVFDRIIYVNQPEPKLASPKTEFVPTTETHPFIQTMAQVASAQPGWSAIVNADIVIGPSLKAAEHSLRLHGAKAAMSRRYEFNPAVGMGEAKVVDLGLDFFAAVPGTWRQAAEVIPPAFRIGHQQWDTWMLGFINAACGRFCFDLTSYRCVFHPKHEGRRFVHPVAELINQHDKYFSHASWPKKL